MRELLILTRLELCSFWGINQWRHTRDPKAKKRCCLLSVVWGVLVLIIFSYAGGLVFALHTLGAGEQIPLLLACLTSLLLFVVGLFTAGKSVFSAVGYDMLSAMPLHTRTVILSRLTVLYLGDWLVSLAVLLPGCAVYAVLCRPAPSFYPLAFIISLLLPILPLSASVLFGTLIAAIAARMKQKSLVEALLTVVFVMAILLGTMQLDGFADGFSPEAIAALIDRLSSHLEGLYPPASWIGKALTGKNFLGVLWLLLTAVAALILCAVLCTCLYHPVAWGLANVRAKHDYRMEGLVHSGVLTALYRREWRRYLSVSIYLTNTILGPILGLVLAVVLCTVGFETLTAALPAAIPVRPLLPYLLAAVFCMASPASVAVSMEGREITAVKSLPIPAKTWLSAKLLFSLTIMLSPLVPALICVAVATRPTTMELLWLILTPLSCILLAAVAGLSIDLRFRRFDWEKPEQVVKQGMSTLLGGIVVGLLLPLVSAGAVLLTPAPFRDITHAGLCSLALCITGILCGRMGSVDMTSL